MSSKKSPFEKRSRKTQFIEQISTTTITEVRGSGKSISKTHRSTLIEIRREKTFITCSECGEESNADKMKTHSDKGFYPGSNTSWWWKTWICSCGNEAAQIHHNTPKAHPLYHK